VLSIILVRLLNVGQSEPRDSYKNSFKKKSVYNEYMTRHNYFN